MISLAVARAEPENTVSAGMAEKTCEDGGMEFEIGGRQLVYSRDVRNREPIRSSFDELARRTFGLSFEQWRQAGWWQDAYEPHVLLDQGRVVANVSVNKMTFLLNGNLQRLIQIGTVMTDPGYSGQGLARFLMERVLKEYEPQSDGIYLYANDSVTGFYPRFGFAAVPEYECRLRLGEDSVTAGGATAATRLRMDVAADVDILLRLFRQGNPFARLSLADNEGLLMFYCTQALRKAVFYCPAYQVALIAEHAGDTLICHDLYGGRGAGLAAILESVNDGSARQAILGFSPRPALSQGCTEVLRQEKDTTLFWLTTKPCPFLQERLMFPWLSHA
jgi:predicted N-acetyltransferase YhbS